MLLALWKSLNLLHFHKETLGVSIWERVVEGFSLVNEPGKPHATVRFDSGKCYLIIRNSSEINTLKNNEIYG